MKKLITSTVIALSLSASASAAQDLVMEDFFFLKGDNSFINQAVFAMRVRNNSDQEIVAYKGTVVCRDAFGDVAFRLGIIKRSANLEPGETSVDRWEPNMFSDANNIIISNRKTNFDCDFTSVQIAN